MRKKFADKHHLGVGDTVTVTSIANRHLTGRVAGIVKVSDLNPMGLGDVTIPRRRFATAFNALHGPLRLRGRRLAGRR